jgi:pullulanase/glycogen debranching enzyme
MDTISQGKRLGGVRTQEQRTGTPECVRRVCTGRPYLQLIMDSLRCCVIHMHVDGSGFDLASALARELHGVKRIRV